jgi:hypothetical protein
MTSVKVFDNLGATLDRYTVVINNDVYFMSPYPLSPQGVNQYGGIANDLFYGDIGKQVKFKDLFDDVVKAIQIRVKEYSND